MLDQVEVGQVYTKDATANIANYNRKTLRQKYAKQDAYNTFKASIWVRSIFTVTSRSTFHFST